MRIFLLSVAIVLFLTFPSLDAAADSVDLRKGLVAHYRLDEAQGDLVTDQSDFQHGGRIFGALWVSSEKGAALDFDGSREWVDCEDEYATRLPGPLTVSAWVRPLTGNPQNVVSRGDWSLSIGGDGCPAFMARPAKNRAWDPTQTITAKESIRLNEWSLLTAVYDIEATRIQLFVNGAMVASSEKSDGAVGGMFRSKLLIGGTGYTGLIADVRLYDRALSQEQISTLIECRDKNIDTRLEAKALRIGLRPHYLYERESVLGEVYLRNATNNVKVEALKAELIRPSTAIGTVRNDVVKTTKLSGNDLRHGDLSVSTKGLEPGKYLLRVTATDETGSDFAQRTESIVIPEAPWWKTSQPKNRDSTVFAPWTPLEIVCGEHSDIASIDCWGRQYEFIEGAFPSQISSAESQILARPIQLNVRQNGRKINWTLGGSTIIKQSEAKVIWSRKLSSESLNAVVNTILDYDGTLLFDVAIEPKGVAKIDSMWLEIPFHKDQATLYYFMRDSKFQGPGAIPRAGIVRPFNQAIWIGNEHCGIQWFAESTQDWVPTGSDRAIEIRSEEYEVVLQTQLIGESVVLDASAKASANKRPGLKYQFGLQATPVRSVENTAWDSRTVGTTEYGNQYAMLNQSIGGKSVLDHYQQKGVKTVFLVTSWTDIFSYPLNVGHKEDLERMTRACHERGIQVVLYLGPQFSDAAPEFPAYLDDFVQWSYPRRDGAPFPYASYPDNTPPGRTQISYEPCIGSEWRYFLLAGAERLMDEFDIDGFYLDGVSLARECHNPFHGCGYHDHNGTPVPTVPLLAGREFIRRLYEIVKSRKPDGQIQLHPGSAWFGPVMGWSTVVWDGETILGDNQSPSERKRSFLTDYLTPEMFRAQYMGHQWGVASEFLSYYIPHTYSEVLSLTLPHDILIRPNGTGFRQLDDATFAADQDLDLASKLWRAGDRFDRRGARWLPYWENAKYVKLTGDKTVASLYQHNNNGVMAVVSNLAKVPQKVDCQFDLKALQVPQDAKAYDALSEEPLMMKDAQLSLELPSLGWKLIRITTP